MFFFKRKQEKIVKLPLIDVTKEEVLFAIRNYSESLPKGVYRTILIKDDYSIDFHMLLPFLKGLPNQEFYMSKETYEIFFENEKHIPEIIDTVQRAVDGFENDHKKYPILDFDPSRKVNCYLLLQEKYLNKQPDMDFYITEYDGLITHKKPKGKKRN
jgi:hypothetical protein